MRREGRSWSNRLAVLCAQRNGLDYNRYGLAVGRRIGKAVVRNRIKRLFRETIRLRHDTIDPGWDMVFIARAPIREAAFQAIEDAITQLLQQARLVSEYESEKARTGGD